MAVFFGGVVGCEISGVYPVRWPANLSFNWGISTNCCWIIKGPLMRLRPTGCSWHSWGPRRFGISQLGMCVYYPVNYFGIISCQPWNFRIHMNLNQPGWLMVDKGCVIHIYLKMTNIPRFFLLGLQDGVTWVAPLKGLKWMGPPQTTPFHPISPTLWQAMRPWDFEMFCWDVSRFGDQQK